MPEETSFLTREQERFLTLHCVGTLACHVERVRAQVCVGTLGCRAERHLVVAKLLENTLPLLEQPLLEMLEIFLGHRLLLLGGGCRCHTLPSLMRCLPIDR